MKMSKKHYSQAYLEGRKYDVKDKKITNFMNAKMKLNSSDNFDGSNSE